MGHAADPVNVSIEDDLDQARAVPQARQPRRVGLRRQGAARRRAWCGSTAQPETRRGRQLVNGDVVTVAAQSARVSDGARPTTSPGDDSADGRRPGATGPRRRRRAGLRRPSADLEQVDHEDQGLAGLDDATGAAVAVAEVRRDDELATAADLHALHALVPAGDDLADAEAELQRRRRGCRRRRTPRRWSGRRRRSAPSRSGRRRPRRRRPR